ncbi:hypothetical protein AMECASPLE_000952 [Ameca splendens]|uniref:Uncharacterized protein n=1 Tax=Ameca splendens TaxID=208324 RepID=A0ABV0ZUD5_9TELE
MVKYLLDHLFAEYWTICTLLDATRPPAVFGRFVSRTVRAYRSRRPLRLRRQGRHSPEATVNYITEDETIHHLPSAGDRDTVHQHLKHHLEKRPEWISFILSLANEQFITEVSGIRRPEISLCRSKT